MTRAIIFDFDGTLADTNDAIVTTMQLTLRQLGLPDAPVDTISRLIGLPLIECVRTTTGFTDPDAITHATAIYRSLWPEVNNTATRLFPDVYDTLHKLKARGLTLAVATSRSRISVTQMIGELGLTDVITTVRADEDVTNKKPAPDMVLSILKELDMKASEAVTIGDTTFDIGMGASAGTRTVGVSYGNHSHELLATANPTFIIDNISDLLAII